VVGLKGAGHGGADLKWAGHVVGVSLSHLGSKKFTQWYSVVLSGFQYEPPDLVLDLGHPDLGLRFKTPI
jgi:hypothetical protein